MHNKQVQVGVGLAHIVQKTTQRINLWESGSFQS